ncbi:MAG: hypothetical protein WCK64_03060 [Synechococcaceae cyanobacterium ELA445]
MLGTLIGALLTLCFLLVRGASQKLKTSRIIFVYILLAGNIAGTSVYYQQIPSPVQIGAALIVGILLVFSELLGSTLERLSYAQLRRYSTWLVCSMLLCSVIAIATDIKFVPFQKSILYFSEPSHFALAISPFVLYVIMTSDVVLSHFILLMILVLSLALENVTLLLVFLLTALILLVRVGRGVYIRALFLALLAVAIGITALSQQYFLDRLTLDRTNLSSLVYLRGIEAAGATLSRPPFIGVGFQMMASRAPVTLAVEQLDAFDQGTLNANDGGFVAAKIITEFGWIGLFVMLYLLSCIVPALYSSVLMVSQGKAMKDDCLFIACSLSVMIQLFIRGSGYLGPFLVLTYLAYGFMPSTGWFRLRQFS